VTGKPVSRVRKIVDWTLGLSLIAVGIVGGFVPVFQGWVAIVAGLAILSSHSRWARALYERVKGAGRKLRDKVRERRSKDRNV
jgi:hypothetical protein